MNNDLARRIAAGDAEAESTFFRLYGARILTIIRMKLRVWYSTQDLEDLYNDTQMAILESLRKGSFDSARGKSLQSFVVGIISNKVARYIRDVWSKKHRTSELDEEPPDEGIPPNGEIVDPERAKLLRRCIKTLNKKYQTVLLLRIFQNLSRNEVGDILDITPKKVSERLNYAQKLITKCVRKAA